MATTTSTQRGDSISTAELAGRLGEAGLAVVDLRPLPEYNGWRSPGAERGGHIPGAVSLPAAWLPRIDDAELRSLLENKGIAASAQTVVYGDDEGVSLESEGRAVRIPMAGIRRSNLIPEFGRGGAAA